VGSYAGRKQGGERIGTAGRSVEKKKMGSANKSICTIARSALGGRVERTVQESEGSGFTGPATRKKNGGTGHPQSPKRDKKNVLPNAEAEKKTEEEVTADREKPKRSPR